jgi:plastocyanin
MYFSRATILSAVMGFAAAQSSIDSILASATSSAIGSTATGVLGTTTPAGMVNTHIVNVGGPNGSLVFSPSNVRAQAGDMIQFQFHAKVNMQG